MSRTESMAQLARIADTAACGAEDLARHREACTTDARAAAAGGDTQAPSASRRQFLLGAGAAGIAASAGTLLPAGLAAAARLRKQATGNGGVAVVGAGLAGLSCAAELARHGIAAKVFEADWRVGGRCRSLRGFFHGQVAELGGEFIGASHHTMLGYARELGLTLEESAVFPGERFYRFDGQRYTEAQVVEEFAAFTASIREDLALLRHPTADAYSETDQFFDFMSLDDYLTLHGAGSLLRGLISTAYAGEYGAGIDALSAVGFLRFVQGDRRGKFAPFGAFTDRHFHVVEGNDRIATGLMERLPAPVAFGHRLVEVRKRGSGRIRLTFGTDGGRRVSTEHDSVVLTLPFSVLREVELHRSLELPAWKRDAIARSAMGHHDKLIVGFSSDYWHTLHGCNGSGFSDRAHLQSVWETNPAAAGAHGAILSRYCGGPAVGALSGHDVQADARAFLAELETVLPGALREAKYNTRGDVWAHAERWSRNPLSRGSYSAPQPGYFTTIAHNEGKAVGNLLFAGEHTSSFYEWQGFMEGAALSGLRAAAEALQSANTAPQPVIRTGGNQRAATGTAAPAVANGLGRAVRTPAAPRASGPSGRPAPAGRGVRAREFAQLGDDQR